MPRNDPAFIFFLTLLWGVGSGLSAELAPEVVATPHQGVESKAHTTADALEKTAEILSSRLIDRLGVAGTVENLKTEDGKTPKVKVFFLFGVGCPASENIVPTVNLLEKQFKEKGVLFTGVSPQPWNSVHDMADFALEYKMGFPVRKDPGAHLARLLGAERVPSVVVLDSENRIRYIGAVDDTVGQGSNKPEATEPYLKSALTQILSGAEVTKKRTATDGCHISFGKDKPKEGLTFNKDIASIIQNKCAPCHRDGGPGKYNFSTYERIKAAPAETIVEVLEKNTMPPIQHSEVKGHKLNFPYSLNDSDRQKLIDWIRTGMKIGAEEPESLEIRGEPDPIGPTDYVFNMKGRKTIPVIDPEKPESRLDLFLSEKVDQVGREGQFKRIQGEIWNPDKDIWVRAAQVFPEAANATHQVIGEYDAGNGKTGIFAFGTQGRNGLVLPQGTALKIPKGSKLSLKLQYSPHGKAVRDFSEIGLAISDKAPDKEVKIERLKKENFELQPYGQNQEVVIEQQLESDGEIFGVAPLAHSRAKDFSFFLVRSDSDGNTDAEPLLTVPRYDSHFRQLYQFERPIRVQKEDTLRVVAHFDNSANHSRNPSTPLSADFAKSVKAGTDAKSEQMETLLFWAPNPK